MGKAEAGVGIDYQDLTRQDVEDEPTGKYLWRVLVVNTRPSAPNVESKTSPVTKLGFSFGKTPPYGYKLCKIDAIAPHMAQATLSTVSRPHLVPVLHRDIPFILNITHPTSNQISSPVPSSTAFRTGANDFL